ncbi:hypothetical protein ACFXK0_00640 [Nocardia sp. NPDC059177]|uniref:hypothetical protein n=1 Tax=Nocardia sp. NPDC059177 TaxID=3346759 RepID=UPI00369EBE3F
MNPLETALRQATADIDQLGYRWALVGGFEVSARSVPRFTLLARDDATRPQDLADLRGLLSIASPGDIAEARGAARLITERGFHRDRELESDLDALIAS